jgi:hypothetical protein
MANILTSGIGGSFVQSPASVSQNTAIPQIQVPSTSSGSSVASLIGKGLNVLSGGVLSPVTSLISGIFGHSSQKKLMKQQYQYQLDLMSKQDQYTRNLTRDSALLNAEGFQRAGLSRAAMQQGSFSAQSIGSTPSAPQAPSSQQLPIAQAVQSLLSTALDNKIKQKQASQIQAETERVDAEKKAITDSNARENALQPSRLGIAGSQDYMNSLQSGYLGSQIEQSYELQRQQIAYHKAVTDVQEAQADYQKLFNDIYKATGKRYSEAQITLMLRQAAESGERANFLAKQAVQLDIDNRFRAEFNRLSNKLLDKRSDLLTSQKNLAYYQSQILRPQSVVSRQLGQSVEDGGLDAFIYGMGYHGSQMIQGLSPLSGKLW